MSASPFDLPKNPRQVRYYILTSLCLPLPTPLIVICLFSRERKTSPNKATGEPVSQEELILIPRLSSVGVSLHCAAVLGYVFIRTPESLIEIASKLVYLLLKSCCFLSKKCSRKLKGSLVSG